MLDLSEVDLLEFSEDNEFLLCFWFNELFDLNIGKNLLVRLFRKC